MNPAELKALRKSAGLTQGQLGHEIGVSRVFVGLMERGLATIERRTDLAVRHIIGKGRAATCRRPSRICDMCDMCDDTGYKDYAGFAMDPCDHSHPTPAAEKADVVDAVARAIAPNVFLPFDPNLHGSPVNQRNAQAMWRNNARAAITAIAALQSHPAEPAGEEPKGWLYNGVWSDVHLPDFMRGEMSETPLYARPAAGNPDTVAFVQEWMMSGDHEADQWHRDFAAAIDARHTPSNPDKLVGHARSEMIEQLLTLAKRQDGYGMSFSEQHGHASMNLYGDRAKSAIWLFKNAERIAAALSAPALDGEKGE